ncbi:MAG: DNRLRE domain-containing protein [Puniceicoccaceae bacterium]
MENLRSLQHLPTSQLSLGFFFRPAKQGIVLLATLLTASCLTAATWNVSNTTQLVSALTSGASGDTIEMAPGTYLIAASLKPKANMTIRGAGAEQTILRNTSSWDPGTTNLPDNPISASSVVRSAYLFDFGSNNGIKLSHMTLDGTKKLHGAIFGNYSQSLELHDLIIKNYRWSGIRTWAMQNSQIYNNQFVDAGGRHNGTTGGMIFGTWTNTTTFFDNSFTKTASQGDVYGIKGREFRNVRISNNTILLGSFSIELPHENDYWVEIDHNYLDGTISIPKGGGGGTVPSGGYTFHIHHNYMTKGYSIESARRGVIIEYNLFDFDAQKDGSNLISNWTPTIQGPMTMRHNLIKNPGRGIYWSDQIYNNFSFHNNHVIANTTATPRTEGLFGMPTSTDFSTITIKDNIIECIGQSRPLVRNSASNAAIIQNNTLINVSGTNNYANPNTGALRGPDKALFFTVGAFDSHQVDSWDFYPAGSPTPQTSLLPIADSYVRQGSASSNFGSQDEIAVKHSYNPSYHRRGFLKFPVDSLNSNVAKADLVLTVKGLGGENVTNRPITIRAVTNQTWSESGITWSNQPSTGETLASFTITAADVGKEIAIDVTDYVNAQRSQGNFASFALVQPNGADALIKFHSREGSAPPRLEVTP